MDTDDDFYAEIRKKNAALWKKKSFVAGEKRTWVAEKEDIQEIKKTSFYNKNSKPIFTITEPYKYSLKMSDNTQNNISGLRNHLFDAIRKLEGGTMKADEAKAMASLAQTIINSAKLELDYKRMIEKQPDIKMLND